MALPYKLKQSSLGGVPITAAFERKTRLTVGIPTTPEGLFHALTGTIDWGCMEDLGNDVQKSPTYACPLPKWYILSPPSKNMC